MMIELVSLKALVHIILYLRYLDDTSLTYDPSGRLSSLELMINKIV